MATAAHNAYDILAELYDEWVSEVVEDIPWYVGLAGDEARRLGKAGLRVVELGAGSGRVTLPLVAVGHQVVAVDTSARQLALLAQKVAGGPVADLVDVQLQDMRELRLDQPADMVIAPFRALLHVADDFDAVLASVRRCLRPGGVLAFDVFNPTPGDLSETDGRWQLRTRRPDGEGGAWEIWERADYPDGSATLQLTVRCDHFPARGAPAADVPTRTAQMRLRTPSAEVWLAALDAAGFRVENVYGWFDNRPPQPDDADRVVVARLTDKP